MADPVAELHRRLSDPLAVCEEMCDRMGLAELPGLTQHGRNDMIWFLRNQAAIAMLQEAERYQCKARARVLLDHRHELDREALPETFSDRLLAVLASTKNRASAGIREARDDKIRRAFDLMLDPIFADFGGRRHNKKSARAYLAEHFGLSVGQVRNITDKSTRRIPLRDDFKRLAERRQLLISETQNSQTI